MTNPWVLFVGLIPVSVVLGASIESDGSSKESSSGSDEYDFFISDEDIMWPIDEVKKVYDAITKDLLRYGRIDNSAGNLQNLDRIRKRPYKTEKDKRPRLYIPKQAYDEDRSYFDNVDNRLRDYSQIYVVLNPDLVTNNLKKDSLSYFISRLVDQSMREPLVEWPQEDPTFAISRRRRESREDRDDDRHIEERRPKRGGNGGIPGNSFGFHTAIPYIRHRGDVYE